MPVIENIPDIEQTFENTEQTIQEKAEHEENKDQKKHSHIHTPRQAFSGFSIVPDFLLIRVFCVSALRTPGDAVSPYRAETYASFTAARAAAANHSVRLSLSRTVPSASLFYIIDLFSRFERGKALTGYFLPHYPTFSKSKLRRPRNADRNPQAANR